MSWTPSTSFYLPTRAASAAATSANTLSFSMIRGMYDFGNNQFLQLSDYYRNGTMVASDTYVDSSTYNATNTAHEIPISGELRMSKFRGAAREFIHAFSDTDSTFRSKDITLPGNQGRKKVQRFLNNAGNNLAESGTVYPPVSGNGKKGKASFLVTIDDAANWIVIAHNRGHIWGGGGEGGDGSAGGVLGYGGAEGIGADDEYSFANCGGTYCGRYDYRYSSGQLYSAASIGGGSQGGGSVNTDTENGGGGGPCLRITCSETGQKSPKIYLYNEPDCTINPGGGGGGGSSGGGGGGGSGGGGGGGAGGEGYIVYSGVTYFQHGGYGSRGHPGYAGATGRTGLKGKRGAWYHDSDGEVVDTTNNPAQSANIAANTTVAQQRVDNQTYRADRHGGYSGFCGSGKGGVGGYSGVPGAGGGVAAGGAGGGYGLAGAAGGQGADGGDGGAGVGGYNGSYSSACGSGGTSRYAPSSGKDGGAGSSGGDSRSPGAGGAAGVNIEYVNTATTNVVSVGGW
jgi:hypothetical protein